MAKATNPKKRLRGLRVALLATALVSTSPALAQLTTSTIRGMVSSGQTPAQGATVTAVNVETGFRRQVIADADGRYILTGLRPGTYDITFTGPAGQTITRQVQVVVGQSPTLDADIAANTASADAQGIPTVPEAREGEVIVVTGARLVETRTSEVGTNVSQDQIENLPQNNRNFLNFAQLAPGVTVLQTETRQTFSGGGVGADRNGDSFGGPQVNVFIDGVSLKSNVQQGGIVGQDVSRGNPFSQLAVQEFRVLTSQYKAEFEDAGTAVITAITKSGTNRFHGEIFGTFQDESLIARSFFQAPDEDKVPLQRLQYGAALGGPIVKDRLFFFANYEANDQDRVSSVLPGGSPEEQALLPFDVSQFAGTFASPFREDLGFAKLTWQAAPDHVVELSGSARIETDIRDFGGQASIERATGVENDVFTGKLKYDWTGGGFLNEFTIDYLKSDLAFGAVGQAGFGRVFEGIIQVGGRPQFQEVEQEGLTFRNNFSLTDVQFYGDHLIKIGAKVSFQDFRVGGSGPFANPEFVFRRDPAQGLDFTIPEVVRFGGGDPEFGAGTTQFGFFIQDDWVVNEHLLLNIGLRYDFETNGRNNDFVTPQRQVEALRALGRDPRTPDFFNVEDFISTGSNRNIDFNNIAPRLGLSYDVWGDQRLVFFGGVGRYYDRALFRSAAEETLLSQFRQGELFFSRTGDPRQGRPTIRFEERFLTPEGFADLLTRLGTDPTVPGTSELRVIPNNLETPYTDQLSVGVRYRDGPVRTSLTFNHTRGKDQIGFAPLNRSAEPNAAGFLEFIPLINGFSNVVAGFNTRETRYNAVFVQVDKPYTEASGFGFGVAYTLAFSEERGFAFNFDFPNIEDRPFVPNFGDERHRIVLNGIFDLPLDFRLSGLVTFASGVPTFIIDARQGFGARDILFPGNVGAREEFYQVDLKLQKNIGLFSGGELQLWGEVFNLFNYRNVARRDTFVCCGNTIDFSPNFAVGPPRSFQFGAAFRF